MLAVQHCSSIPAAWQQLVLFDGMQTKFVSARRLHELADGVCSLCHHLQGEESAHEVHPNSFTHIDDILLAA
jgi:hypothetical protein